MRADDVRRLALALTEAGEEPHFELSSFRVRGKIFATLAPDGSYLNVFVDDTQREQMIAMYPQTYQKLWWGKKVVGLRVTLPAAKATDVEALLKSAWQRKAPKALLRS